MSLLKISARRHAGIALGAFLLLAMATLQAEDIPLIDSTNPAKGWGANNGAEFPGAKVSLVADPAVNKDGKPSLRLTADLTGGGMYCDMSRNVKAMKLEVESVSFWLKAPGLGGLTLRLGDGGGRCHQIKLKLDPVSDDWRLVSFPIARFFEKRGTAEAVQGVAQYQSWGGLKGKPDGWNGQLQSVSILTGQKKQTTTIWVAGLVATVRSGTTDWSCGFEDSNVLPAGWKSEGTVKVAKDAFKGANSLALERVKAERENPCSATTAIFPVVPGVWEISAAMSVDLESPDASYCGSLHFEAIDASGKVIETMEIATPYGQKPWQVVKKQVRTPLQTTAGRLVARINKTVGTFRLDDLAVKPLDTTKKLPAVDRIVLATAALGNLFKPEDRRAYTISVESTRALSEAEQVVTWSVRDYWGGEQAAPGTVTVKANGKNKTRFRYEASVDLAAVPLEMGRYYEFHAQVPLSDNEPFKNSSGFATLPIAATKSFPPAKIPFNSRNWDGRIGEYIRLADRLGVRWIGLWGDNNMNLCKELGAGVVTGCGANVGSIERKGKDWEKWTDEATIRKAVQDYFAKNGAYPQKPLGVVFGNEPNITGEHLKTVMKAYKIAYDEVKKVAPETVVIPTSVPPIEEWFQAGYGEIGDVYDFHVYETPESVRQSIKDYQALMKKYKCEKPIWSTEIGLNSQGLTRQHISGDMIRKFAAFFAAGGVNIGWFDYLYPDPDGKALGTSGDSFNMFDSRYCKYAVRLDGVCCYNLMNGILDKKFTAEKTWADGTYACLFRNPAGECFVTLWRGKGRADLFLPLPGVKEVTVIHIDGRRTVMQAGGKGIGLTVCADPLLLAFKGPATLPETLGESPLKIVTAPVRLMRGAPGVVELSGTAEPQRVTLLAPPLWTVAQAKDNPLHFTVNTPENSLAREGDILIRVVDAEGAITSELGTRPILTGLLAGEDHFKP
ncbi:MAG: hypothetical protein WCS52_01345 [bacterium]